MVVSAVSLARAGLAGSWLTRFSVLGGALYALGSLSITSPDGGIFGALRGPRSLLFMLWTAVTSHPTAETPTQPTDYSRTGTGGRVTFLAVSARSRPASAKDAEAASVSARFFGLAPERRRPNAAARAYSGEHS